MTFFAVQMGRVHMFMPTVCFSLETNIDILPTFRHTLSEILRWDCLKFREAFDSSRA